ncbi:MAG: prepilin-type N-terminal cleavage/methylation domain-containing protein [Candidatus Gottesmanbacteria bacterium]
MKMKKACLPARQGFTLMEILVAISIIAVLTAIGIVSYTSINKNARNAKRRSDIEQMRSALELYRSDFGYYPAVNTGGLNAASNLVGVIDAYMSSIPTDPKAVDYNYPYAYQATDLSGSQYYGYCIAAIMETSSTDTSVCSVGSGYNYSRKNP